MRALFLCTTLLPCLCLFASASSESAAAPIPLAQSGVLSAKATDYAGESAVVLRQISLYSFNLDGTGYREQSLAVRVQSEAAVRELGILNIGFAGASERVEIEYARVRRPDGTLLETPVADALEQPQPVTREAPFYSDLKQKQLPIKSLRVGDTLEWKIRVVRTKAEATGQFWGQDTFVQVGICLSEVLELRVPKAMAVNVWTNPLAGIKPVEATVGEQRTYRWESASLHPTAGAEAEAEKKRVAKLLWTPAQELDAKQGKLPSVAWTTFKSWEEVGSWYRGLEGSRMVPDDTLKAKVAELVVGKTSLEDKVRAIYGYVGPQVRYIGVAFGVGRYQPHHAEEVLENQYGDCKDKHTLLAAMLTVLGLHPDAVLIGAGIRFNEAVPSPGAFNHLITRVDVDGKETWLDSTAEVAPYRLLNVTIRGHQALVVPETGEAKVLRTPATPPFESTQAMKVTGTLTAEGVEESHVTMTDRGDAEVLFRAVMHQLAPAQYEGFGQQLWSAMGFAGSTSHFVAARPEDTAEPFTFSFDDKREKAGGDWDNLRIVAELMPASLSEVNEKEPPVQAIQLGGKQIMTSSYAVKLPEGWRAELPEAIHESTSFATYDLTYRFDEGTVYAERKIELLADDVPATDWHKYKEWMDKVTPNSYPYIQLTHPVGKSDTRSDGGSAEPAGSNEEAAKLIQQAYVALRTMKVDEAAPLLDKAKGLNNRQRSLWAAYGYVSQLKGAMNEAITDYRKELELHPDSYGVYRSLSYCQALQHRRIEQMDTLRAWAAANPSDPSPYLQLSAMEIEDGKGADAYRTVSSALDKLPEEKRTSGPVRLALGTAEIKNGMETKGAARLVDLLKTTEDPLMLNNAAYILSEAGLELPAAEAAEHKVLESMGAETVAWTLDEAPAVLKGKTSLLAASWDTMGWILFREGKLEEARAFVQAAWFNRPDGLVGEHLGDIDMARHQPDAALTEYELAKAAGRSAKGLDEKEALARKAGGKMISMDAQKELAGVRTIKLGAANNHQGSAEYRMLLKPGKVLRAEATGEKKVAGGDEMIRAMRIEQMFPPGSDAQLAKFGILNCHANVCEMIFEP